VVVMCAEVGGVRGCLADARLADGVTITATRKGVLCCAVAAAAVAGCAVVVAVARWRWPDARWWLWLGGGGRVCGGGCGSAAVAGCAVVAVARWRWPGVRWWLRLGGGHVSVSCGLWWWMLRGLEWDPRQYTV
jgi:hypothetical protein